MQQKKLFNENGERGTKRMIGGQTTNLREWNRIKYPWAYKLYKVMLENFWLPSEIQLLSDKKQFDELNIAERRAVDKTIAFLNFLDSEQCENLPHIANYITAPEVSSLINIQTFQEEIHAQSYSYIIDTICDPATVDKIYDEWRNDPILLERIKFIADTYQKFVDNPNERNFIISVFADYLLEAVYFYSGFMLFHTFARQGKLVSTDSLIRYIQKDELTHVVLFQNIFKELRVENPELFTSDLLEELNEMMATAVDHEIKWGQYVTNNEILGISNDLIDKYIKWTSNERMASIGLPILYPDVNTHPMKWIESYADSNGIKTDFFEQRVTNYVKSSGLDFDDL